MPPALSRAIPLAVASVALGAAAWVLYGVGPPGADPCDGARDVMARLWSDERRAEAASRVAGKGLPELDRFAERWTWHAVDRCYAKEADATLRGSWASRELCGQRQAEVFDAVVWALGRGATAPDQVVEQLPEIADCESAEYYRAEPPLPANPNRQAAAMALRLEVAKAEVLLGAGELSAATDKLDEIEPRVEALGYPALEVEAQYLRLLAGDARDTDAASSLVEAAEAAGYDRIAARAWLLFSQSLEDDRTRRIAMARVERTMDPLALEWLACLETGGTVIHGRCSAPR